MTKKDEVERREQSIFAKRTRRLHKACETLKANGLAKKHVFKKWKENSLVKAATLK